MPRLLAAFSTTPRRREPRDGRCVAAVACSPRCSCSPRRRRCRRCGARGRVEPARRQRLREPVVHLARTVGAALGGERTNCAISGVAVAPVPLSNYAIDVDIPSGLDASVDRGPRQRRPGPARHAGVDGARVARSRRPDRARVVLLARPARARRRSRAPARRSVAARRVFTDPWLGLALAVAAVGFAWQGLVRRRVLDTLGRAALLAVMVTGGLWIIADPAGTVGAVGNLADQRRARDRRRQRDRRPGQPVASVDGAFGDGVRRRDRRARGATSSSATSTGAGSPAALDPRLRVGRASSRRSTAPRPRAAATRRASSSARPAGSALQSAARRRRDGARERAHQRRAVPRAARRRRSARTALSTPSPRRRSTERSAGPRDPTGLHRADRAAGRVSHRVRDLAARRRSAADRRRARSGCCCCSASSRCACSARRWRRCST